jgi:NAD(P)-dependent dehydrogenase (short-subunit alcohol dehydrogenase family)
MKTVLVTGANKGIGFEVAKQLAEAGYFVWLGCRNEALGKQAANTLHQAGLIHTQFIELDVTNPDSITKARQSIESRSAVLDVLINNAGIRGAVPQPASSVPMEELRKVYETNFFGMIQVTQEFIPLLRKSDAPRIVNVTSELGSMTLHSDPDWKYYPFKSAAYSSSKAALNAYTIMLAYELRDTAFKVNAVNPGHTATDFNNYRGEKKPEDAAGIIVRTAMLGADGPSGKFISEEGELPW